MSRIIAAAGWLALVAAYYLSLPMFGALSFAGWLVLGALWVWAVVATIVALVIGIRKRAYPSTAVVGVVAVLAVVGIVVVDWTRAYADSQVALQRGPLDALVAEFRAGRLPADAELPVRIRYMSIDGHAHVRDGALYLPAWQDWRGESGGGFGYFAAPPSPETTIATAEGDLGHPTRSLGGGWWWVD
jgi:uncharacterized membrane protein